MQKFNSQEIEKIVKIKILISSRKTEIRKLNFSKTFKNIFHNFPHPLIHPFTVSIYSNNFHENFHRHRKFALYSQISENVRAPRLRKGKRKQEIMEISFRFFLAPFPFRIKIFLPAARERRKKKHFFTKGITRKPLYTYIKNYTLIFIYFSPVMVNINLSSLPTRLMRP